MKIKYVFFYQRFANIKLEQEAPSIPIQGQVRCQVRAAGQVFPDREGLFRDGSPPLDPHERAAYADALLMHSFPFLYFLEYFHGKI